MNARVLVSTKGMSREAWLDVRRRGIGGSDAPACVRMDPYRSRLGLYLEKTGQLPDAEVTEPMRWGSLVEPVIAQRCAEETGWRLTQRHAVLAHPEHDWMLANPDRFVRTQDGTHGLLEIKDTAYTTPLAWAASDAADRARIQVQHYLAVTGLDMAWVAVKLGNKGFHIEPMPRDDSTILQLIEAEAELWDRVVRRDPPPADAHPRAATELADAHPDGDPDAAVELGSEWRALLSARADADERAKAALLLRDEIDNRLRQTMGDATEAWIAGQRVATWRTTATTRVDLKRLREEAPELAEKYATTATQRRFLFAGWDQ